MHQHVANLLCSLASDTDCDTLNLRAQITLEPKAWKVCGLTLTDRNSPLVTLRLGELLVAEAGIRAVSPMEWKVARPSLRPR